MTNDSYIVKVQETHNGELFVELPQSLLDKLGWRLGDEVGWKETEICENWGEHIGLTLSNLTKTKEPGRVF